MTNDPPMTKEYRITKDEEEDLKIVHRSGLGIGNSLVIGGSFV